ncbi:hypothetical protein [Endozoicomonas euniceicola]|uniref:CNP1-like family protein n=1 Tax=Endozoicomonas euniceicola TaxID=1234143 RepID=A0ABY6GQD7_9GAMM|nr:hypothetical protein [Endozoicomonas euniceicola]UYM14962.1 hypothetical protein NX720_19020 [Endozoicomonas euniceicola]
MTGSLFQYQTVRWSLAVLLILQALSAKTDTPYWPDFIPYTPVKSINDEFKKLVLDQPDAISPYDINNSSTLLLAPDNDAMDNEYRIKFQGIITVDASPESGVTPGYQYDFQHQNTTVIIESDKPTLITYDNRNGQIIDLQGKGCFLADITAAEKKTLKGFPEKLISELYIDTAGSFFHPDRLIQVYMMSATSGGDGNQGNDRKGTNNNNKPEKPEKPDTSSKPPICDKCKTPRYDVDFHDGDFGQLFVPLNIGAARRRSEALMSSCSAYSSLHYTASLFHPGSVNRLESYPPCSFYAKLDHRNPSQPAIGCNAAAVLAAITLWSRMPASTRDNNPPVLSLGPNSGEDSGYSEGNSAYSQDDPAESQDDSPNTEEGSPHSEEEEQPNRCITQ